MDNSIIIYAIKASVALALFYGLYILLFRKDTFCKIRRIYFLFAIVFSLAYPFFSIELPLSGHADEPNLPVYWLSDMDAIGAEVTVSAQQVPERFSVQNFALMVWAVVSVLFLLRFLVQFASIVSLRINNPSEQHAGFRLVRVQNDGFSAFSFFNWVFLNVENHPASEVGEIIAHESVHVRQLHSVDVIVSEVICLLFWWNPVVWLMKRDIKINLEYLADKGVLETGFDSLSYQYALLQLSSVNTGMSIINNFNVSQLKKRITMMNKRKSPIQLSVKYFLAVPLVAVLLLGNAVQASADLMSAPLELVEVVATAYLPDDAQTVKTEKAENKKTVQFTPPVIKKDEKKEPVQFVPPVIKKDEPENSDKPYTAVEVMPQYPGGTTELMKYISENLRYPLEAAQNGIQGRVILRFIVSKDGSVRDVVVQRGFNEACDKEAVRVVEAMPKWTPGKQNGKVVDVYYTLPVMYKLSSGDTKNEAVAVDTDKVYDKVEVMPLYPGGPKGLMEHVVKNLKYPMESAKKGTEGRVVVRFIVDKIGVVKDATVLQSLDANCDAEALRIVNSMSKWTPGTQGGEPVSVYFVLPINFKLQKEVENTIVRDETK